MGFFDAMQGGSFGIGPGLGVLGRMAPDINQDARSQLAMLGMADVLKGGSGQSAISQAMGMNNRLHQRAGEAISAPPNNAAIQRIQAALSSPHTPEDIKRVLMKRLQKAGVPGYRRGVQNAPGGLALVGEAGPELVQLPAGSDVLSNPELRAILVERLRNGGAYENRDTTPMEAPPPPEDYDPRDPGRFWPEDSFLPGAEYQTAELDAYKMMQQRPQYDASTIPANKLTEGQAKTLAYLRRAMFANAAMKDPRLAKAMTRMDNNAAGALGAVGRLYTDDDYELGRLMAEQFASAILRRDSGAQTPEPEVQRYMRQYFPLSNETDEQLAAKEALRGEEIRALQMSLGNAAPLGAQIQAEIDALVAASQKEEEVEDLSEDDKAYLKSLGIE